MPTHTARDHHGRPTHPLVAAAQRLGGPLAPVLADEAPWRAEPGDEGSVPVARLTGADIARWSSDIRDRVARGHRRAAAIKLTDVLVQALFGFSLRARYLERCVADLAPDNVMIEWREGRVRSVSLARPITAVAIGHSCATHPDAVPVTEPELDRCLADGIAATGTVLLDIVREHYRGSLATLWGRVADLVHAQLLRVAIEHGGDTHHAWRYAEGLTAAIGRTIPWLRNRPRPFPVLAADRDGRPWHGQWLVFGTCCLLYQARPDHSFCNVCPLRDDSTRSFDWPRERPPARLRADRAAFDPGRRDA